MSNPESLVEESFEDHLLEYPHYTRPVEIEGLRVPEVLISGDHGRVERWRREQRIEKTKRVRPDLYDKFLKKERGEET
jgi:tRNA (guanine37-N1)-methyltransferase